MNKQCPSCQTAYNVSSADVGREFPCFKCNAALVVHKDGIRLANAPGPQAQVTAIPAGSASQPETASDVGNGWRRWRGRFGDVATWTFGIGAFLVIIFLFFPLINQAKVARAKVAVQAGQLREDRMERELKQKKDVTPADEELRKKARDNWAKQKDRLAEDADELGLEARQSDYWYTWGMMFGFLFLAGAALAYLNPAQPTIRRVVGAIVIIAEVLLIFIKYLLRTALS